MKLLLPLKANKIIRLIRFTRISLFIFIYGLYSKRFLNNYDLKECDRISMNCIKTMEEYDCDIGILDYAIESANFEIAMGNEEYLSIQEAFIKKKEETLGAKVKRFIDRIIKFFKDLLDKIKNSFSKFQAWMTRKKIQRKVQKNIENAKIAAADKASRFAIEAGVTAVTAAGIFAIVKFGKVVKAHEAFDEYMRINGVDDQVSKEDRKEIKKAVFANEDIKKAMKVNLSDMIFFGNWIMNDIRACINIADKARKYTGAKFKNFSYWISERLKFDRKAAQEFEVTQRKFENDVVIIDVDPKDIK